MKESIESTGKAQEIAPGWKNEGIVKMKPVHAGDGRGHVGEGMLQKNK